MADKTIRKIKRARYHAKHPERKLKTQRLKKKEISVSGIALT
jgi:hypothetical protein